MKRTDLVSGELYAAKNGPASKDRYRVVVLDPLGSWSEFSHHGAFWEGSPGGLVPCAAIAKNVDGVPVWEPVTIRASLIAEPWAVHLEAMKARRERRADATREKDAKRQVADARCDAVCNRLGIHRRSLHMGSFTFVTMDLNELEGLAATMSELIADLKRMSNGEWKLP